MTAALLQAIRRVVPAHVEVCEATPLNQAGIDSLALIEIMVHLEDLVGLLFDETTVRRAVLQPDYDPTMPVAGFGLLLLGLASAAGPPSPASAEPSRPPEPTESPTPPGQDH